MTNRSTRASRSRRIITTLAALALPLVSLVAAAGANDSISDRRAAPLSACETLFMPANSVLAFHAYATGVQIYRWNGTSWSFVAPAAALYSDAGLNGGVGIHYAGPTWESVSGGKVVGAVVDRCTADQSAIPWLSLSATPDDGPGIFHDVTFIQRVNTTGGLAPSYAGSQIGEIVRVPYTAEYLFFRAQ